MGTEYLHPLSFDRVVQIVEKVRSRLLRVTAALEKAGVRYAVIGGNAVAVWVARVDPSAVRNTADVDLLIHRQDLEAVVGATAFAGFIYRHAAGIDMLLDGPDARARDAVHLIFAGERVRPAYSAAAPDVTESEHGELFQVLNLEALVRMKLTSFRTKDQMHLRDMLDAGLIDASWCPRYQPELAARLQLLIDTPED